MPDEIFILIPYNTFSILLTGIPVSGRGKPQERSTEVHGIAQGTIGPSRFAPGERAEREISKNGTIQNKPPVTAKAALLTSEFPADI